MSHWATSRSLTCSRKMPRASQDENKASFIQVEKGKEARVQAPLWKEPKVCLSRLQSESVSPWDLMCFQGEEGCCLQALGSQFWFHLLVGSVWLGVCLEVSLCLSPQLPFHGGVSFHCDDDGRMSLGSVSVSFSASWNDLVPVLTSEITTLNCFLFDPVLRWRPGDCGLRMAAPASLFHCWDFP